MAWSLSSSLTEAGCLSRLRRRTHAGGAHCTSPCAAQDVCDAVLLLSCCLPAPRCRARQENKAKAAQHLQAGNMSAAYECYQRAVDVTPAMAKHLIEVCGRAWLA